MIGSVLIQIGNSSLLLKAAVIKPPLKMNKNINAELQADLPFISKMTEKAVLINTFLALILINLVSVFITAFVKVFSNIRINTDRGRTTVLVLLDLIAAFDTVDHSK